MIVSLLSSKSLVDILDDQALQEIFDLFGMLREGVMIEMEFTFDHIANNFQFWVSGKWYFSTKHDIKDYSHWPNVNLLVVVLQENFWSDVIRLRYYD